MEIHPFSKENLKLAQVLSMTIISVGKLQWTYLCGVSDSCRKIICRMPNWKANSPLVQNDGENRLRPGVSVDSGSWRCKAQLRRNHHLVKGVEFIPLQISFCFFVFGNISHVQPSLVFLEPVIEKSHKVLNWNMSSRTCLKSTGTASSSGRWIHKGSFTGVNQGFVYTDRRVSFLWL